MSNWGRESWQENCQRREGSLETGGVRKGKWIGKEEVWGKEQKITFGTKRAIIIAQGKFPYGVFTTFTPTTKIKRKSPNTVRAAPSPGAAKPSRG